MNKLVALAVTTATFLPSVAMAADMEPKFYAGAEALYSHFKLDDEAKDVTDSNGKSVYAKKAAALGLFAGSRLNQNFGVEFGGQIYNRRHVMYGSDKVTVRNTNVFLDALGLMPVNETINFIGSVGIGRLSTTLKHRTDNSWSESSTNAKFGYRLGLGAEYLFGDNFNMGTRAMLRFQKGNHVIKNVKSASLGLFYNF